MNEVVKFPDEPLWFRSTDTARLIGVHRNRLRHIPAEELPYMVIDSRGDRRYSRRDIALYVSRRMVYTTPPRVVGVDITGGPAGNLKLEDAL